MRDAEDQSQREDHPKHQNHPEHDQPERENQNQPKHEDHPERDTVNERIDFEWTPELVKIGTSRGAIHPSIGPIEYNGQPSYKYWPGMTLPDPANTRECLKWAGLSDQKIVEVEQKFNDVYPDYQGPACGYEEKHYRTGYNKIVFPKVEKMLEIFIQGMHDDHDEFEYNHKFAIFCGLHKDDPRAIDDPRLFEEKWFGLGPADIMGDTLIPFWIDVEEFIATKLVYEGKAWDDCYGRCLVREGESLDQAKARMNDQERERLKEQAAKQFEAEWERKRQEWDRKCAEDEAIWAEEDRQEAEMLQQQNIDKTVQQKDKEGTQ
ncbi:unnamed protein product [Penicillium egyptiacum]|uniref:Uncharacterized protein n=1 Tax=Penicillium egyptiacum TaxID=1303716 RepID=A0A9W4KRJ8_9EURO|nr:unnamed protein product [Penicillium egyptiacum]